MRRTTRSVNLTEAGERLYASARPALEDLRAAATAVSEMSSEPRGTLRLQVAGAAESFLSGTLLADFLGAHPHLRLDVLVSDQPIDIIAESRIKIR